MRDILFKAKAINRDRGYHRTNYKNGDWVYGLVTRLYDERFENIPAEMTDLNGVSGIEIDHNTICQYTGLTDKNGNKIWENDIIKYHFGNDVAPIRYGEYQSCFDNTKTGHIGFYVDWNGKQALRKDLGYWVNMIDCNVIGNTIDNPELIGA